MSSIETDNLRAIEQWEKPDSWAGKPWRGWYVGLGRNRDACTLTESNFEVFLRELRKLPEVLVNDNINASMSYRTEGEDWSEVDSIQVVCESHWGCGWIEWVAIHPDNEAALRMADEMMCELSDYPVLDEEHYSSLEHEEVCSWWGREDVRWRAEQCRECGVSIFAARHDMPPEQVCDYLREQI